MSEPVGPGGDGTRRSRAARFSGPVGTLLALALLPALSAARGMALSAPQGASSIALQSATLELYSVAPAIIDPGSVTLLTSHVVSFDPGADRRAELLVFLGGFVATPADAVLIVQQAATNGFHAIGLLYAKPVNINTVCQSSPDDSCFEAARRAVIWGGDDGGPIRVAPADSIVNQLTRLITNLAAQHPDQGWMDYLDNGLPRWSGIRLAGHSNGESRAALIARDNAVALLGPNEAVLARPWARRRCRSR